MRSYFQTVWRYRHFLISCVQADFRAKFARSRIAGLWIIIQPLIQVTIYAVILSAVLSGKFPGVDSKYAYAVYLLSGSLAWGLFSEIINRSLTIFIEYGNVLKKISFPRVCLPLIVILIAAVNYALLLLANLLVLFFIGRLPGAEIFALIPLTLILALFASALGLILGTLNVFMRDVGPVLAVVTQLWFWFTPIVYPLNVVPAEFRSYVELNPLTSVVQGFQQVLLYGAMPNWQSLIPITVLSFILAIGALIAFRGAAPEMTDVL
jgi:lipopolysaccharide transport system permease protein